MLCRAPRDIILITIPLVPAQSKIPVGRWHTTTNPELPHDAEREALPRRLAKTRVPRHTMGEAGGLEEDRRMDRDGTATP